MTKTKQKNICAVNVATTVFVL